MTALMVHVEDYLRLRRHLGFVLEAPERLLRQFVSHLDDAGMKMITVEAAVAWAGAPSLRPVADSGLRAAVRLTAVRGLAEYLHAIDPAHQVPPRGVFSSPRNRHEPFIYGREQIAALLQTTRELPGDGRGRTWSTVFGLLAVTGIRIGEALLLRQADTDLVGGVLTVSRNKNRHPRLVPLRRDSVEALDDYAQWRERERPAHSTTEAAFFTGTWGKPLSYSAALAAFQRASAAAGLREDGNRPRIHDLRH